MTQFQMPKCPACGDTDFTDESEEFEVGVTTYEQKCESCGAALRVTRTVECWYQVEKVA